MSSPPAKPFLVASDLHLGAVPAANERRFREFLDYAATESAGLLINGDLFEFGISYRSVVPRKHVRVLAKLAEVVESGVPVYFVPGNHDHVQWGGQVLEEDVGVTVLDDSVVLEIAGRRALITHGDTVGEGAEKDQRGRRIARSRLFVTLIHWLHPDWVARVQPYTTSTRRQVQLHASGQGGGTKHRAPAIEKWACDTLRNDGSLDFVIAAHAHLPARVEVEPGRFYLNAGDWITHCTYIAIPDGGPPEVRRWVDRDSHVRSAPPR
ncbi:MAG: UDP-2,3-diacylglucosamine diphosphatase [Longimicrobiales bacterium]